MMERRKLTPEQQAIYTEISNRVAFFTSELNRFPRGPMGLTPDAIKFSPEYRAAKSNYQRAFEALRMFNSRVRA